MRSTTVYLKGRENVLNAPAFLGFKSKNTLEYAGL